MPCKGIDHIDYFSADGSYLLASCEFAGTVVKVRLDGPDESAALDPDERVAPPVSATEGSDPALQERDTAEAAPDHPAETDVAPADVAAATEAPAPDPDEQVAPPVSATESSDPAPQERDTAEAAPDHPAETDGAPHVAQADVAAATGAPAPGDGSPQGPDRLNVTLDLSTAPGPLGREGRVGLTAYRRGRHLRRRRNQILVVLLAVAVLVGVVSTSVLVRARGHEPRIGVTVLVGGRSRPVWVAKSAKVGAALKAAHVAPHPGRMLSLVTHTVLSKPGPPAALLLNGQPASAATRVAAGATINVVEPPDTTEATIDESQVLPAPPEPDVISRLWHPGRPGRAIVSRKGTVSGEVDSRRQLQAPVPPTPVTEKLVALTFDDGPWPTTPDILRILREKNVKALFCVVTRQVAGERLAYAQQALADGNQLCNHTVDHDETLPAKPQKTIDDEIIGANIQLNQRLALHPTYYRPPGGALGPGVIATAKAQGQQVLTWNVDTKDYTRPPPDAIVAAVLSQVQPGSVVLMHDGGGDRTSTVTALPIIIDRLRAAGYDLVLPDTIPPVSPAPITPTAPPG